ERHQPVAEDHGLFLAAVAIDLIDEIADLLLAKQLIDQIEADVAVPRQNLGEQHPPRRRIDPANDRVSVRIDRLVAGLDAGVQRYRLGRQGLLDIADAREARDRHENDALILDGALQILDPPPDEGRLGILEIEDRDVTPLQALLERFARRRRPFLVAEFRPRNPRVDLDLALEQTVYDWRVGPPQFPSQPRRLFARRIEEGGPRFDRLLQPADDVMLVATREAAERQREAGDVRTLHRDVIKAEHDVLRRHDDRLAVGGAQDVVCRHHQDARFELRLQRERNMHRHLVAVEIGVEGRADERMQLNRLALDQDRLEGLDAEPVQRRGAVQQDRMLADHLFEDVPHLGPLLLDHALGRLDRAGEAIQFEFRVDERLEQLQPPLLPHTPFPPPYLR